MQIQQYDGSHVAVGMFGDFAVYYDGKEVSGQLGRSKKLKSMAEYLILNYDRAVPNSELYDVLWPNETSVNPRNALKTLMHRLRSLLAQGGAPEDVEVVIARQGTCQWNPALNTQIDVVIFEGAFKRLIAGNMTRVEQVALLREAIGLYRGRFLDDSEMWMVAPGTYLHSCYLKMVKKLCKLLEEDSQFEEIADICRHALRIDELDEALNRQLILALIAIGRNQEAMERYNHITDLYYTQLGVQISEELRELYRQIVDAEQTMDLDVDSVRDKLQEKDVAEGAFYCEYSIFKDLYRIETRCLERYGGRMFLGLLTVTNAYMEMPEMRVLSRAMDQLLEVVKRCLRKGDIVSRFSPAQYVLLLPTVTYETGQMVLERIQKAYRREFPKSPVIVSFKLRPLLAPDTIDAVTQEH